VGVRVPNCDLARKILERTGPLATTSANISGQPALKTTAEIEAQFPEVLTLVPGELETITFSSGLASTVAKWNQKLGWEILRQGSVRLEFVR
jgi:L-threonylcarbamoyladenylate synthase